MEGLTLLITMVIIAFDISTLSLTVITFLVTFKFTKALLINLVDLSLQRTKNTYHILNV